MVVRPGVGSRVAVCFSRWVLDERCAASGLVKVEREVVTNSKTLSEIKRVVDPSLHPPLVFQSLYWLEAPALYGRSFSFARFAPDEIRGCRNGLHDLLDLSLTTPALYARSSTAEQKESTAGSECSSTDASREREDLDPAQPPSSSR